MKTLLNSDVSYFFTRSAKFSAAEGSFSFSPHLTRASIYMCNEWFYEVEYEDQICLSWPY